MAEGRFESAGWPVGRDGGRRAGASQIALDSIARTWSLNGSSFEGDTARTYTGGSGKPSSRSTVLRDIPNRRAIRAFGTCSRWNSRCTSAQSCIPYTSPLLTRLA